MAFLTNLNVVTIVEILVGLGIVVLTTYILFALKAFEPKK